MRRPSLPQLSNLIFIAAFAVGITANFWIPLTNIRDYPPFENRKLQSIPILKENTFSKFKQDYNKYYLDHFSIRYRLINLERTIRYRMFSDRYFSHVVVGENQWLYFANDVSLRTCQGVDLISEKRIEEMITSLTNAEDFLSKQGTELFILILPAKCTIYPEYSTRVLPVLGTVPYIEQIYQAAAAVPQINTLDIRPTLLAAKADTTVYYQTDTHWNQHGIYLSYREIIPQLLPGTTPIALEAFQQQETLWRGDLAKLSGIVNSFWEARVDYSFEHDIQMEKLADNTKVYTNLNSPNDLTLVFFHDSFFAMEFPKTLFANHFRRTVFLDFNRDFRWSSDPDFLSDLMDTWQPDVVLLERTERIISSLEW